MSDAHRSRPPITAGLSRELFADPAVIRFIDLIDESQLVITQNTLGAARKIEPAHFLDDTGAVRAAVDQVSKKNQRTPLWVTTKLVVPEVGQQLVKRIEFTVNIADDVDRTTLERLDRLWHLRG